MRHRHRPHRRLRPPLRGRRTRSEPPVVALRGGRGTRGVPASRSARACCSCWGGAGCCGFGRRVQREDLARPGGPGENPQRALGRVAVGVLDRTGEFRPPNRVSRERAVLPDAPGNDAPEYEERSRLQRSRDRQLLRHRRHILAVHDPHGRAPHRRRGTQTALGAPRACRRTREPTGAGGHQTRGVDGRRASRRS